MSAPNHLSASPRAGAPGPARCGRSACRRRPIPTSRRRRRAAPRSRADGRVSRSCSIEVLWAPTSAPPAMRLSTLMANFTPSFSATAWPSTIMRAADRVRAGIADHLVERRAGQRADRVEGHVAPQLDPQLVADARPHRRLEAGLDQQLGKLRRAFAAAAVRLAQREAVAVGVVDDAGLDDVGSRIDDAAEHLRRRQACASARRRDRPTR